MFQREAFKAHRLGAGRQAPRQHIWLMLRGAARCRKVAGELVHLHPGAQSLLGGSTNTSGKNFVNGRGSEDRTPWKKTPPNSLGSVEAFVVLEIPLVLWGRTRVLHLCQDLGLGGLQVTANAYNILMRPRTQPL